MAIAPQSRHLLVVAVASLVALTVESELCSSWNFTLESLNQLKWERALASLKYVPPAPPPPGPGLAATAADALTGMASVTGIASATTPRRDQAAKVLFLSIIVILSLLVLERYYIRRVQDDPFLRSRGY